jgi:peptide/nickel transport system permease protein
MTEPTAPAAPAARPTTSRRRLRDYPWIPIVVLVVLLIATVFAPWLAPHDPESTDLLKRSMPPGKLPTYPLGTDLLGRDILSRLIFGARTSVLVGLVALGTSALVGTVIGIVAGYLGGRVDTVIMRIVDVGLAFPTILLALLMAVFLGVGLGTLILAVTLTMWARFARMMRGSALAVRDLDFVVFARISGVGTPRILVQHILPNIANTLLVTSSILLAQVILMEASLAFLGLGLAPGAPAWGVMVAEGRQVLGTVWWLSLFPGLAIAIVVLSLNLFGDWLRETLDPRLRHVGI